MSGTSPGQRREWAAILVLAGLVGLGPLVVAAARDLAVPLGSDAPLWGLSVLDAAHGRQASLPPLFGQLAAVLHLAGLSAGTAARVVSSLSLGLTCLLAAGVARAAGARTGGALVAALLVAGHPDLFLSALLTQPDVVATAAFSAVAVALALAAGAPTPRRLALVGLSLLLAYPAREQGLIVVAFGLLALGVLAAAPADGRSAGRRLALAAGAVLATLLIIQVLSWTHGAALLDPPWRPPCRRPRPSGPGPSGG